MENFILSKNAEKIIEKYKLYAPVLTELDSGIIICEKETLEVIFLNDSARSILNPSGKIKNISIDEIFENNINELFSGVEQKERIYNRDVNLKSYIQNNYVIIVLSDITDNRKIEETFQEIMPLNKELQASFDEYGDENIMVTNKDGIIILAGEKNNKICGVDRSYFIGKSVYDIEKEKIFSPSVSVEVLKSKRSECVVQKTQTGQEFVSVGTPLFDENGELDKIVSISKDFTTQLKICCMLAKMSDDNSFEYNLGKNESDTIVTCNEKMFQIKWLAKLVAPTDSTVLISGATGTGKTLIAEHIHNNSKRKNNPFIEVNCGSIASSIVESELYGYEEGAFTGANKGGKVGFIEAANGGTLFLDEISELPIGQQAKLLHVLQEKQLTRVGSTARIDVNIRIIAATNKDLKTEVESGNFREDLYYRLNVVPIMIPTLEERKDDIPLLSKYFLEKFGEEYGMRKKFSIDTLRMMKQYSWPGNVRELENVIERLVVTSQNEIIDTDFLPDSIKVEQSPDIRIDVNNVIPLDEAVATIEKKLIQLALKQSRNTTEAAAVLGVNQSTISRKMSKYNLELSQKDRKM